MRVQSTVFDISKSLRLGLGVGLLLLGVFGWAASPRAQSDEAAPQTPAVEEEQALEAESGIADLLPETADRAVVLDLTGPIGPALARYIIRGIENSQDARLIVLEMDTPGGLDTSMREMIQAILASDVPVATYVSPSGARAASAGAYIMYASHIAAMAPGTAVGAATPVQMGGGEGGEETGDEAVAPAPESATAPRTALEAKAQNDAVSLAVELAQMRGRNVEFAESMVRDAASIGATEALDIGVIEFQVGTLDELLTAADGMTVTLHSGDAVVESEGATVERLPMTWMQQLLTLITDPNIAFLLMSLGTIGIIAELYNPGSFFPGIFGAICLVLAFYSLSVIPFSSAGLALLVFGLILMAAELFVVSGGILAAAGFVSFALGAFFLFDSDVPGLNIDLAFLIPTLIVVGAALAFLVVFALGAMARRVSTGPEELIGMKGNVVKWDGKAGLVFLHSETWNARSKSELAEDQTVVVKGLDGLTLLVAPA